MTHVSTLYRLAVRSAVPVLTVVLLSACHSSSSPTEPDGPGAPVLDRSVRIVSGDGQAARPGEVLAAPLRVEVRDADGRPASGVDVLWSTLAGGGEVVGQPVLVDGVPGEVVVTTTDGGGIAEAVYVVGPAEGPHPFVAHVAAELDRLGIEYDAIVPVHAPNPPPTVSRQQLEEAAAG